MHTITLTDEQHNLLLMALSDAIHGTGNYPEPIPDHVSGPYESLLDHITAEPTTTIRSLLIDWLDTSAALAAEFCAVKASDLDDLNAHGRQRAAEFGIDWDNDLERASRGEFADDLPTDDVPVDDLPDHGEVVLCAHRGQWFEIDRIRADDDSVYLHGKREYLGPIPLANLTNLGPTADRFWIGDKYATGNHWDLLDGARFPNLLAPSNP